MERMDPSDSLIDRVVTGENPAEHQLDIISTCPRETGEKAPDA